MKTNQRITGFATMTTHAQRWNPLESRFTVGRLTLGEAKQVPFAAEGWVRRNSDYAPLSPEELREDCALRAQRLLLQKPEAELPADIADLV